MNETDDPHNHVPEVSPEDDWEDSNAVSPKESPGLPPRRGEVAHSQKKASKPSPVKLHQVPAAADEKSGPAAAAAKLEGPREEQSAKQISAGKRARNPKKTTVVKKLLVPVEEPAREGAVEEPVATSLGEPGNGEPEEVARIVPVAPAGKQARIHEIGRSEPVGRPAVREVKFELGPERQISPQEGEVEADGPRARRRFADGELVDWGEDKGREPVKWMLWAGLCVAALVVLMVVLSLRFGGSPSRESEASIYSQMVPREENSEIVPVGDEDATEGMRMLLEGLHRAPEIYARFATAKSPEEIADLLFKSEEVLPLVKANWESPNAPPGWIPDDSSVWSVRDSKTTRYGILEGRLSDFRPFGAYFRNSREGLKLDWKATTGYGTATFDELVRGEGEGSEIRCMLAPSDFYTFSLAESEFHSFRLGHPAAGSNVWAYVRRGSELEESLYKLFTPSPITGKVQREALVTLRLSPGPEDALPNQWMIEELIHLSWLGQ